MIPSYNTSAYTCTFIFTSNKEIMPGGLASPLGIASVILIVIGIVMAVIGIILLLAYQNKEKPWYIWFLLVAGVVVGIAGGVMLAIALARYEDAEKHIIVHTQTLPTVATTTTPLLVTQPAIVPAPAPVQTVSSIPTATTTTNLYSTV